MEPTKKDHNLRHLSFLTFLVFSVGFIVLWMLSSVIWGISSRSEKEVATATNVMQQKLDAIDESVSDSLLDNLDVDQSSTDVMGVSTGDQELDTQIKDLNTVDLNSIEKDYK
jgi:hypothetical protein